MYVADTLKRIVEANRWLDGLGVPSRRYRLKERTRWAGPPEGPVAPTAAPAVPARGAAPARA